MQVIIKPHRFDPYAALVEYQQERRAGSYGAVVSFVGVMRDFNEGGDVSTMTLEYYPGMTEKQIERSGQRALKKYSMDDALVIHRVGEITPDEPIVLVAVWSAHRSAAFDGCRYIINDLKQYAPFWKSEQGEQGACWVTANTPDIKKSDT